jgi:hypothetical protein
MIVGDGRRREAGLFPCGIDKLGRVWRMEEHQEGDGDGVRLVLAGRLQT